MTQAEQLRLAAQVWAERGELAARDRDIREARLSLARADELRRKAQQVEQAQDRLEDAGEAEVCLR